MNVRKTREDELKLMGMWRDSRQYSYDLVQRLSFFVISIELVFCGYILLNAEKLGAARFSSLLFLLAGCAAIFGIIWRFSYNQRYHDAVHGEKHQFAKYLDKLAFWSYWIYVSLTAIFLIGTISTGFWHIRNIEKKSVYKDSKIEEKTKVFVEEDKITKTSKPARVKSEQSPKGIPVNKNTKTQTER